MADHRLTESGGWVNGVTRHRTSKCNSGMQVPSGVMGVVMHTMVGWLAGTDSIFTSGPIQSSAHFGVGQDGKIIQWVSIRGGVAWHAAGGNQNWYGIEHEDGGNPRNPLTEAALNASAQLVELLSRVGNFKLQVSNDIRTEGYGTHYMGGRAWSPDLHTCPDSVPGQGPRSKQRAEIIKRAASLRATGQFTGAAPAPATTQEEDMPAGVQLPQNVGEYVVVTWNRGTTKGVRISIDETATVVFEIKELHFSPDVRWVGGKPNLTVKVSEVRSFDHPEDCGGVQVKLLEGSGASALHTT